MLQPGSSGDPSSPAAKYLGDYRHIGGQAELDARDAAIDGVVADMSFLSRGIARDKLKDTNPIASNIRLSASDAGLTIAMDERAYTSSRDGGPTRVKGITGDALDMNVTVGDEIEQRFSGDEKGRVNHFRVDGDKLIVRVRVFAEALPKDVVYELTYQKI